MAENRSLDAGPEAPCADGPFTILLLHERGGSWSSSQFSAGISTPPWSALRLPHAHGEAGKLASGARAGTPAVDLDLARTSRPGFYLYRDVILGLVFVSASTAEQIESVRPSE